jgi:hypothetical protein
MPLPVFDEAYVRSAAAAVGLELPADRVASVIGHLQRIAAIAAPALAPELDPTEEIAPVWRP